MNTQEVGKIIPDDVLKKLEDLRIKIRVAKDLGVKPEVIVDPKLINVCLWIHGGGDPIED